MAGIYNNQVETIKVKDINLTFIFDYLMGR